MIQTSVQILGLQGFVTWLDTAPGQLVQGAQRSTATVTRQELEAIVAATTRRTGTLASSFRSRVDDHADGATGRIYSDLRYASFVDRGTAKHGHAQRMVERGAQRVSPGAGAVYEEAIQQVLSTAG